MTDYVGRFAPSPTGHLHLGSLVAALASAVDARHHGGLWHLRIDNIDPGREDPDACEGIPASLQRLGFVWDGDIQYQATRTDAYHQALHALDQQKLLFTCVCSRRQLRGLPIYPGTCRACLPDNLASLLSHPIDAAIRLRLQGKVQWTDQIHGAQHSTLDTTVGDVVVWRRDHLPAYVLATTVDDAAFCTHVVRGADLREQTHAQVALLAGLGHKPPLYAHVPMVLGEDGDKLSKQTHAPPVDALPALPTLHKAWQLLGQHPLAVASVAEFWKCCVPAWSMHRIPGDTNGTRPGSA